MIIIVKARPLLLQNGSTAQHSTTCSQRLPMPKQPHPRLRRLQVHRDPSQMARRSLRSRLRHREQARHTCSITSSPARHYLFPTAESKHAPCSSTSTETSLCCDLSNRCFPRSPYAAVNNSDKHIKNKGRNWKQRPLRIHPTTRPSAPPCTTSTSSIHNRYLQQSHSSAASLPIS